MKHYRILSLMIVLILCVIHAWIAFPISQSCAADWAESGRVADVQHEKDAWVALVQDDTGRWEVVTARKSWLFDRFQVLDRQERESPDYVSESSTAQTHFSYVIQNGTITIHDPKPNPLRMLSIFLLIFLVWSCIDLLFVGIAERKKRSNQS
ncbi:MAG: hypothetical protein KH050_06385 [Clostridiaceae bacterium]|nr:hypothetical protein [Clostridiaceae bacterium]